jgi:hypothetical protein
VTTEIMERAQEQTAETRSISTLPVPGPLPKARRHDPAKQSNSGDPDQQRSAVEHPDPAEEDSFSVVSP